MNPMKLIITLIFAAILSDFGTVSGQIKEVNIPGIPGNINMILKNSCFSCHGSHGKLLALAKLNLSEWDKYDDAKKVQKAARMCSELDEEAMPPKSFRKSKPELIPTPEQIELICKWADSLRSGQGKK